MTLKLCAIVPTYNHHARLGPLLARLQALGIPALIIDDGNREPARSAIGALDRPEAGVRVVRREVNGGKGAAVKTGFAAALQAGYSHALQIDADGQHDSADIPLFVARARAAPAALICGAAVHDGSIPKVRKYGRAITTFWVRVETLSLAIADAMCGFRLYPLRPVQEVLREERIGDRMEFDIEILVHLHWRGVPVITQPTRVTYPPGNSSSFAMLRDNLRISLAHARLALQMPLRVPARIARGQRGAAQAAT